MSQPWPHARAGHALPKTCGHSHVVMHSFWCHATCQSLSTELRGQHLAAFHTSATNTTEEAKLQAVIADEDPSQRVVKNTNSVERLLGNLITSVLRGYATSLMAMGI